MSTRYTLYGYGGGHTNRYALGTSRREDLHMGIDKALDQGYTNLTVKTEEIVNDLNR